MFVTILLNIYQLCFKSLKQLNMLVFKYFENCLCDINIFLAQRSGTSTEFQIFYSNRYFFNKSMKIKNNKFNFWYF